MKGKQLAFVLVLVVAFGAVALYLNLRNTASWSSSAITSKNKILDFQLNDVSQTTIKSNEAELNLVKKDDVWTVKERADYPADFTKVSSLLKKLWELYPVQDMKVGASQLGRLQLTEPGQGIGNGMLIDLKAAGDKQLGALLLGKKVLRDPDKPAMEGGSVPVGRYIMARGNSDRVYLVSDTFDDVLTKPEQWLNRDFFKIEKPKSITVTGAAPGVNWKVTHDGPTSPWKLVDAKPGEELDNSKAAAIASVFSSPSFNDVLPPDAPASETGLDKPSTIRIDTFDGFVYDLQIGKLNGENYPIHVQVTADLPKERTPGADEKPEDKEKLDTEFQTKQKQLSDKLAAEQKIANRTYLMVKSTVEQALKDRTAMMAEKKSPTPAGGVAPAPPNNALPPNKPPVTSPRKGPSPVTPQPPAPSSPK
jgi:hypothetical protein